MRRNTKIASMAFTGVAAMGAVGLGAGPALAAGGTWTINEPNGTAFAGSNKTSATLDAGGINLACKPGTALASGTVSGNGKSGVPASLASVTSATFGATSNPCSFLGFDVTANLNRPVHLVASQATTTAGVTKGYLGGAAGDISATVTGVGTFACHMTVSGSKIPGSYYNSTNTLKINPSASKTLTIKAVSGCDGAFTTGETAYFQADYVVSPALTITGG
ncbi:MAG TPA: hypothetical protein VGG75_37370 [Trebonia sp.]|jgi:hypothetical protein